MMNNTNINFSGDKKVSNNNQRERNRRYKRLQRDKKRKEFLRLKKPNTLTSAVPVSVQDVIEVRKIAPNGIWEVGENLYSKTYLINDLNYCTMTYQEQVSFSESGAEYLMLLMFICLNSLFLIKIGIWLNLKTRFYINIKRMNIICRETVITILSQAKL